VSVKMTLITMFASLFVGFALMGLRTSRRRGLSLIGSAAIEVFRDTPVLVMLMWTTYVLPNLLNIEISAFWTAFLALAFQTSAYLAETFRSGLQSIPPGQWMAARALGMTEGLLFRRVILPQLFRRTLPEVLNQVVVLFKTSTLVSIVAVKDLMYVASRLVSVLYKPMEIYTSVAIVYLACVLLLSSLVRRVEDMLAHRETYGKGLVNRKLTLLLNQRCEGGEDDGRQYGGKQRYDS
jgi:polar amino acid transport system permease protein